MDAPHDINAASEPGPGEAAHDVHTPCQVEPGDAAHGVNTNCPLGLGPAETSFEELVYRQDLNEVYLLLDFISGRPDKRFSDLDHKISGARAGD